MAEFKWTMNHISFIDSLTTKLPFDDDEFDHVHVRCIARAVPENKVKLKFESKTTFTKSSVISVGLPL